MAERNLYLVTGVLITSHYMADDDQKEDVTRLVWATDDNNARTKFGTFFEKNSRDYDIYYRVLDIEVHEAIV